MNKPDYTDYSWRAWSRPFTIPASEFRADQTPQRDYAEQQFYEAVKRIVDITGMETKVAMVWAARLAQRIVEHSAKGGKVQFVEPGGALKTLKVPIPVAPWAATLGLTRSVGLTEDDVNGAYRAQAKRCHPDAGGTPEQFVELGKARDAALKSIGKQG